MNTTNTTLKLILPFLSENIPEDSNIIIGCSGGADSTALAILLSAYSTKTNINIKLVYVNHNLRDSEMINNEKTYVASLAKKYKFKYRRIKLAKDDFKSRKGPDPEKLRLIDKKLKHWMETQIV